ncbi:5-oxoprolinase subunit B/C family protein [Oerskovia turbata]
MSAAAGRAAPHGAPRVRAYGDHALMVDVADLDGVHALAAALRAARLPQVVDVVPAARTVLVLLDDAAGPADLSRVEAAVRGAWAARPAPAGREAGDVVEIPVVYDGQDLPDVAAWAGLSVAEVVARHGAREYVVAFGGFMPGFGYLREVDPSIAAPRLATPRTRVPAGSVALAGELTAVYPRETPGGWRLLGRTDVPLFDVERDPPALLTAGTRVRFVAVDELPGESASTAGGRRGRKASVRSGAESRPGADERGEDGTGAGAGPAAGRGPVAGHGRGPVAGPAAGPGSASDVAGGVEVVASGPLALIEDSGRAGWASAGVGRSGAADRGALALANRLLANDVGAAAVEATFGGLALAFHERATIVLTGAPTPAILDGMPVGMQALLDARPGAVLRLGVPTCGLRTYVGVRGGFDVPRVLGSRSHDVLAGLGPDPLVAGRRLAIGPRPDALPVVDAAPPCEWEPSSADVVVELRLRPGVRPEWFDDDAWAALLAQAYEVSSASNRVGLRLSGEPIARRAGELPSEGLVPGAVQIPPDGRPVLFLRDHPVTGGYPVIGVVEAQDVDRAAQLRPGDRVRFRPARTASEPS